MAAQIIPTDDTPGAREARVIYFIDRALATFAAEERSAFAEGLKTLQKKARKQFGKAKRFSDLSAEQQRISAISEGTVRLSIGLEDLDDLRADLARGLHATHS